jgi:hypothetical protein
MQSNLTEQLGYKGSGVANGLPAYSANGIFTLGGVQATADVANDAIFGYIMSSSASGDDGTFYMGIPTNYIIRGMIQFDGGIAQNDPAKPNKVINGAPLTLVYWGTVWLGAWTKTSVGAIDPIIGAVVICNNTTGAIEFQPNGTSVAPAGWTIISANVVTVSTDTNGALLFLNLV